MKVELNTDICPLVVPDTYGNGFQYEIADDCWDEFKEMMCDIAEDYIKDALRDTKSFKSCTVKVSKELGSPQFYNYGTDWIDFDINISDDIVESLKEKVDNKFLQYIKKFGSRSGFISFYPTTEKEIEKAFATPGSRDFSLLIAEFILYEFESDNNLDAYQHDYIMDVWDKASQNGYEEDYEDEEFDESRKVKSVVNKILEGKDVRKVLAEEFYFSPDPDLVDCDPAPALVDCLKKLSRIPELHTRFDQWEFIDAHTAKSPDDLDFTDYHYSLALYVHYDPFCGGQFDLSLYSESLEEGPSEYGVLPNNVVAAVKHLREEWEEWDKDDLI